MMYTAATHLVEVETGTSFAEFLEHRFFNPLGMQSTSLQPARAREKGHGDRIAKGHLWNKGSYHEFDTPDCPEGQGAGSVISSANDFIKWVKALMNQESPINEQIYQGLTKMRSIVNPNARRLKPHTTPAVYAAGMEVYYYRGEMVVAHDGNIPGFGSRFVFLPNKKLGVVVLGNSSGAGAVSNLTIRALIDEILNVPSSDRQLRAKPQPKKISIRSAPAIENEATAGTDGGASLPTAPTGKKAKKGNKPEKSPVAASANQKQKGGKKPQQPQETPLEAYLGTFTNTGYRSIVVQIKEGKLFVDASDRAFGFTLTFEHKRQQREYVAHLCDTLEGGDDPMDAEFVFENNRAVRLGLDLEPAIRDLVWFDLVTPPA